MSDPTRPILRRTPAVRHGLLDRRARLLELEKTPAIVRLTVRIYGAIDPVATATDADAEELLVTDDMDGLTLLAVAAGVKVVSSSGAISTNLYLIDTDGTELGAMLSTALTIDAGERSSYTAATAAAIDPAFATVAVGQSIRFDIVGAGTGAKGLQFYLDLGQPNDV